MSAAQDLHDKIKALVEEFKGTPGLDYPLTALAGILGHLRPVIRRGANTPKAEEPATDAGADTAPTAPAFDPVAPAGLPEGRQSAAGPAVPSATATRPAPAVQVAKPKPPA